jgi:mannose-6-phosphate isomerase
MLGKELPGPEAFGESWEVSDHPLHPSVVACGPTAGRTLRQLMEQDRTALLGPMAAEQHARFPWLVKFLDACDWLSVQVHPDTETVQRLWPGEGSKTEAWLVLDTLPGSKVWAGLLPGVDERRLRAALQAGTVADCLHSFTPRPGDCVFLPAGTVHAVGGGVLMAEVQQTSDATFRLFDWNRRDAQGNQRQLHIEEALASIHWTRGPVQPLRAFDADPRGQVRVPLVECPFFTLAYVHQEETFTCGGVGRLQMLVVVHGGGSWSIPGGELPVRAGEAWLLPASMPATRCVPQPRVGAALCTLPE